MKLRMKGNSLRIRLTKTEVDKLSNTGCLEEHTVFTGNQFIYALQAVDNATVLSASLDINKITMFVPRAFLSGWPQNDITGIDVHMPINEKESLYLLLEKDFVCLDENTEDQSDNYENPNKAC